MSKRYIILQPIGHNTGSGVVSISDSTVTVSLTGTDEELNIYFFCKGPSGERINAGNIRGGFAKSFELLGDTAKQIDTVVLLKKGEPVIYGSLAPLMVPVSELRIKENKKIDKDNVQEKGSSTPKNNSPLGYDDGFTWLKIEDGRFAENCPMIRHIFENIGVIGRINDAGFYYYGTKDYKSAVAIASPKEKGNPFLHIAECARYINGYWTVGADKKERCFYSLKD